MSDTVLDYIKYDRNAQPIMPELLLAKHGGSIIGGIKYYYDFNFTHYMNNADEISFSVNKFIEGKLNPMWDEIKDFRLVYVREYKQWFQIGVSVNEDENIVKSVTGTHLQEAELGQLMLYDTEINTEDDIARDDYTTPTVFYDEKNPKNSLINRILTDKAPHYTIYHVDDSLKKIQRSFSFDGKSIYDALQEIAEEIDCLFVFGEHDDINDLKIYHTISAYDLEDVCADCGERGNFYDTRKCSSCGSANIIQGYGEDTNIFVSSENLADSVSFEIDNDSVKNCFRLTAGDDLMTATVRNMNPNGTNYIYYFTPEMRSEMSDDLQAQLKKYDDDTESYRTGHTMENVPSSAITAYNALVDKYADLNKDAVKITDPIVGYDNLIKAIYEAIDFYAFLETSMAPGSSDTEDTTAEKQAGQLTADNLSPVGIIYDPKNMTLTTANSSIVNLCAIHVDTSRYKVEVASSSYDTSTAVWAGSLTVTSLTDDEDTFTTDSMTFQFEKSTVEYVKQLIDKAMAKEDADKLGVVALFKESDDDFKRSLKQYSLDNLSIFQEACISALNVMTQQGLASEDSPQYSSMYLPYYQKGTYIEDEMAVRADEIKTVSTMEYDDDPGKGLYDYMVDERDAIMDKLNIMNYLNTDDLWKEFCSFRREDEYSNDNYISDGLTNTELVSQAQQFLKRAQSELIKSATMQKSISGDLKDFLVMPEFNGIKDYFQVGNWIHLQVDGRVYKLRIISISVDYSNLENINAQFSDVINNLGTMSDVKSILDQAKSMATSYSYITNQVDKSAKTTQRISNWVNDGLALTNMKIVNSDNQNVKYDSHGILLREYDPITDTYDNEQVKIINHGLYLTDDSWMTAKTGIGKYTYIDPETGETKEGFGVIADTLIGNLILSKKVGVYNEDASVKIDNDGITITGDVTGESKSLFNINVKEKDGTIRNKLSFDSNGNMIIGSDTIVGESGETISSLQEKADTANENALNAVKEVTVEYATNQSSTEAPTENWSTTSPERKDGYFIWQRTVTKTSNDTTYSDPVCITGADGKDAVLLIIESSNGTMFKNTSIATNLTVTIIVGGNSITDSATMKKVFGDAAKLTWEQKAMGSAVWTELSADDSRLSDNGFIMTLTAGDISEKTVFQCNLDY